MVSSEQSSIDRHVPTGRQSYGYRLWHVVHRWQRQLERALSPLGLTHLQFVLLSATAWLVSHDELPTQTRLAEFTGFDRMMVSKVLRLLEQKSLIERIPHPRVRRGNAIGLTVEGKRVLRAAQPLWEQTNFAFFGRLGSQATQLGLMLDTLLD